MDLTTPGVTPKAGVVLSRPPRTSTAGRGKKRRSVFCAMGVGFCLFVGACGDDDIVVGGVIPTLPPRPSPTPTRALGQPGDACNRSIDCVSGICDPATLTCR